MITKLIKTHFIQMFKIFIAFSGREQEVEEDIVGVSKTHIS
jgi:hypothetical protein